jgi:hypothetical protein
MLDQPEYVHVAINHFPLVGLLVAMVALVGALALRNRAAILLALALVALLALSAWPVAEYGESGYDRVLSMSDEAGGKFLAHHRELADRWLFLYFITAGVAGLGLALAWRWPRTLIYSAALALALGVSSLSAGIAIAKAGGCIRHREFRTTLPP